MMHTWGSSSAGAGPFFVPGAGSATDSGEDDLVIGQPGDENRVRLYSENNDTVPLCWFFGTNQSDNASAPHNQVWNQGWNTDANGAAVVNTEHVARFSMESNYLTGGQRFMEWHWQSADGAGANARRGVSMSKNRGDHTLDVVLDGDITVFDSTGVQQRVIIQDSTGGTTNFIINSCAVLFNLNNTNILQCLNAAGTQYVVMMKTDNSDRVVVGGTNGAGVILARASTTCLEVTSSQVQIAEGFAWLGDISPTQLSGNVDNYDPSGNATCSCMRIDGGAASRNITGIAQGSDGRWLILHNIGTTNNLVIVHDATSTAANRFFCPGSANLTLTPNSTAMCRYDATSQRWRVMS